MRLMPSHVNIINIDPPLVIQSRQTTCTVIHEKMEEKIIGQSYGRVQS